MPECIDGELEFEIEKIMLHDLLTVGRTKQLWYLIRWKGFSDEHDTWEPTSNLTTAGCQKLLTKYKQEHKLIYFFSGRKNYWTTWYNVWFKW